MQSALARPPLAMLSTLSVSPGSLPPLPRRGERADGLSPAQRRAMVLAILAAHLAAVYGLMQVREVREAAREVAPMFVDLIAPPAPPAPPVPPPPPTPQPITRKPPPPAPVIAAAPSPAPATFVVPAPPPPEPAPVPAAPAPMAVQPAPAPPAPPPAPKLIPASAVQYLEPPAPEYPRLSKRNGESGSVVVRVFIDTAGQPREVQVGTSSGFARLDDAAVSAVKKARFKPYTENGLPTAGWTHVPINFELEK